VTTLLAADVGGTNCRLALFEGRALVESGDVPTEGPGFVEAARGFLKGRRIDAAGVAVAGPVLGGEARLTNHHWRFVEAEIGGALGCPAALVNDFYAAALGLPELEEGGWRQLSGPAPEPRGIRVALGPGTGLGQAALLPAPGGWTVVPSEGGHIDFAPGNPEELELARWLMDRYGHVSWERVLSGPGLVDMARFYGGDPVSPAAVTGGADGPALAATARFCKLLGARAGDLALGFLPTGGVWLCGGIPPRLGGRLEAEGLLARYTAKGRFEELVARHPLLLVTDDRLGLRGAAAAARARL
jgi:glucokinase